MRKKWTPLAEANDGTLYIEVKAIMNPWLMWFDGLPVTFFGKEKTPYMKIEEALAWLQKESADSVKPGQFADRIDAVEKIIAAHKAGQIVEA